MKNLRSFQIRLAALLSLASFTAFGQNVFWFPSAPKPARIAEAKAAFERGDVVAMRDADAARFDGILNVGLPASKPEPGEFVARHCIAAAKKTARGRVRLFAGDLLRTGINSKAQCATAFDKWLSSTQLLEDNADPNGWTEINSYTVRNNSLEGDEFARTTTIYRANTTDPNNDYFMVLQENVATAAANSLVLNNSSSLMALYGDRAGGVFDYGPQGMSAGDTFTIGSKVPIQDGSAAYTDNWSGTAGIVGNGYLQSENRQTTYLQQQTSAGSATLKIPSLLYDQGAVFTVDKGTTAVDASSSVSSEFVDASNNTTQFPQPLPLNVRGVAPVLNVPSTGLYVLSGSTNNSFQLTASAYLSWTLSAPAWVQINGQITSGTGSQTISFAVGSGATPGTVGTITIDTNPAYASPSVTSGPLQVQVHVIAIPPSSGVLLAGGTAWNTTAPLASAEIWSPATKTVTPTNSPMTAARASHTATVLSSGLLLIAGGIGADGTALNTTELFDPGSATFTPGPLMNSAHATHTATTLQDGTVLIAGGVDGTGGPTGVAEIYDPATNLFTQVGSLTYPRQGHCATLLNDGTVILIGGELTSIPENTPSDLYDPIQQSFQTGAAIHNPGLGRVAIHLANDQVLVVGGVFAVQPGAQSFLYTPSAGTFSSPATQLSPVRHYPAGLLLPDETAILIGGYNKFSGVAPIGLTDSYNPSGQVFSQLASSIEQRDYPTAVLVPGSSTSYVVVAGGVRVGTGASNGTSIELFDTTQKTWATAGAMSTSRTNLTSTYFVNQTN